MDSQQVIQSQYLSALAMLEQAVTRCPDELWDDPNDKTKLWHIAYHALFYPHLYLQKTESDFVPWAKHRAGYHAMDPDIGEPYDKADMVEYIEFCRAEVGRCVAALDPAAHRASIGSISTSLNCRSIRSATFNSMQGN